jgi:hypothetical protein
MLGWHLKNLDEADAAAVWSFAKGKLQAQEYLEKAARQIA